MHTFRIQNPRVQYTKICSLQRCNLKHATYFAEGDFGNLQDYIEKIKNSR